LAGEQVSAPRLEWTQPWSNIRAWVADAGHLRMVVGGSPGYVGADPPVVYSWEVGRKADIIGSHIESADGLLSLADAQFVAESYAIALLCEGIAEFAVDPPDSVGGHQFFDALDLPRGDLEQLGCALIAAASRASREDPP
jgi:hypothetical protein